jgi:hypothetical protein
MNRLACAVLLSLAACSAKEEAPAFAPTSVVSLYDARVKHAPGTPGLLVAEVGIGAKGAKLLSAPDDEVRRSVEAALADLGARPFLPMMEEEDERGGTTVSVAEAKPGDERYPWAVGGFLLERTGLRYDVRPYKAK